MKKTACLLIPAFLACLFISCDQAGFVKENLKTFHEFKLKNGIPVTVKITEHSRTKSVVCTVRGGKGLVPPEKAGLDKLTLQLMTMESEKYPDVTRRAILKRTSASIGAGDGLDYARYYLKSIDSYFDETFDLYADIFTHPAFSETFFEEVKTNLKNKYLSDLSDGYARVSLSVNRAFFEGHPYYSYLFNTKTIENITLEDVKVFYGNNFVASRMALFAVGDFDISSLKTKLEAAFGNIEKGEPFNAVSCKFNSSPDPPLSLDPCKDLKKETGYVRGNFEVIPVTHKDYWALVLASSIVSDIMTDLIRTKNSMVYSVWSNVFGKKSNYANISVYRTNNPVKVVELINEAIDIAASGKCVSPYKGENSSEEYVPVSDGLAFYKTSFSTGFYAGLQTNMSIAMKMADSYIHFGDYTSYLMAMEKIKAVSAKKVQEAVVRYIKTPAKHWAITAHPDTIEIIKKNHKTYSSTYRQVNLQ